MKPDLISINDDFDAANRATAGGTMIPSREPPAVTTMLLDKDHLTPDVDKVLIPSSKVQED